MQKLEESESHIGQPSAENTFACLICFKNNREDSLAEGNVGGHEITVLRK